MHYEDIPAYTGAVSLTSIINISDFPQITSYALSIYDFVKHASYIVYIFPVMLSLFFFKWLARKYVLGFRRVNQNDIIEINLEDL